MSQAFEYFAMGWLDPYLFFSLRLVPLQGFTLVRFRVYR